jgi:hypothetical protein
MTNSVTTSPHPMTRSFTRAVERPSDEAPMVVTRLSGWIDIGECKSAPSWIVSTSHQKRRR